MLKNIFARKISLNDAFKNQRDLLFEVAKFKENTKPKKIEKKQKIDTLESINALYESIEMALNPFKSIIFSKQSIKSTDGPDMLSLRPLHLSTFLKVLTFKHMIQRFSVALAHLKAGNSFENVQNEICLIICSLC